MRKSHGLLALVLALAACQPAGMTPIKKTSATPHPTETVAALASTMPSSAAPASSGPSAAASPAWDTAIKLEAPAGQATVLSGVIKMDPSYIVAAGAGNLVAAGGGNIVAAGGGNVVAAGGNLQVGGRIVAAGGGNIVAAGAGNVISGNASAIVAAGAGNIVASGAGNIVAAGAGNLTSLSGGGVISGNAGARRVLDAAAAPADPIPGAGMLVSVLSLRNHQYLGLGKYKDADGQLQDVYSIYTNADGAYKLYLPPEEAGNVLVVASPPGQTNDDRLIYNVVSEAKPHDEPIDEDAALAGRYLHFAFSGRVAEVMKEGRAGADYAAGLIGNQSGLGPAFRETARSFFYRVLDEADKYDVQHWKNAKDVDDLATSFTDVALSYVDPHARITHDRLASYGGPEEEAIAGMAAALKLAREETARRLAQDPQFFATHQFDFRDNCDAHVATTLEVKKSTDPGDYLVSHFLTTNVLNGISNVGHFYDDLGLPKLDAAKNVGQHERLEAAAYVVLQEILTVIVTHEEVFGEIKRFCTRDGFKPELDATRTPAPVPTCAPKD